MQLYKWVERKMLRWGVPYESSELAATVTIAGAVLLLAVIANVSARRFISSSVSVVARRTEATWDDMLAERHVFDNLAHLASGIVIFTLLPIAFPQVEDAKGFIRRASLVYMVVATAFVIDRLLTALVDMVQLYDVARQRPIKSYAQVFKILNYIVTIILFVSIALGQSPAVLLGGLGALSAVLLLVFKDPLLGLVASVQLSANDMVRRGDPIEVPKHGIDGEVVDMSLTTVKVQAADKSIATLPNYLLVSDSFRNLRGIREAGVRRLKRGVQIDVRSIRFIGSRKLAEIARHREIAARMPDLEARFADRQTTNVGVFRAYIEACALKHPEVASDMQVLARQLPPTERGIGVELNCYFRQLDYAAFEKIQAELFEHIIAMAPIFDIRLFQNPTAMDEGTALAPPSAAPSSE